MANTEYCVSSEYFICECGDNFPDEEKLQLHVERTHNVAKSETIESHTVVKEEPAEYLEYYTQEEVAEETQIILDANSLGNKVIILNPSGDPDNMRFTFEGKEYYIKQETKDEPQQEIAEETQEVVTPSPLREVVFRADMLKPQEVVLDQVNAEHDYDRETVKNEDVREFFFCDVCGKTFTNEKLVNIHLYRMHGIVRVGTKPKPPKRPPKPKNCVCDVCGKHYASNAALRYHQRVHTGEKPYKCALCPKAFTMPLFLQVHTRIHTGERPYGCNECPKAFTNKAALSRHRRVHTGEKPYRCPECDKCFTQSNSMKLHVHTVHLKLPTPYKSVARKLKSLKRKMILMEQQEEPEGYLVEEMSYDDDDMVYEDSYVTSN